MQTWQNIKDTLEGALSDEQHFVNDQGHFLFLTFFIILSQDSIQYSFFLYTHFVLWFIQCRAWSRALLYNRESDFAHCYTLVYSTESDAKQCYCICVYRLRAACAISVASFIFCWIASRKLKYFLNNSASFSVM